MLKRYRSHPVRSLNRRPSTLAVERLEGRWVPSATVWHDLEPNDQPSQAQALAVLSPLGQAQIEGVIDRALDVDWYRFDLSERSQVALQLTGNGAAALFQADPHDPSQLVPVAEGAALEVGSYFVSVSGAVAGDYQLALELTAAAPTFVDLGTLQPQDLLNNIDFRRDYRSGLDTHTGDADYFAFTVLEQNIYTLSLYSPSGARVALSDDAGNALTPSYSMSAPTPGSLSLLLEPGTYRLRIDGWNIADAGQVAYTLRFTAGIVENPTPLPAAPSAPLRLRLTTNAPHAAPAPPTAVVQSALRLSLPGAGAGDAETLRFVSTVRLNGVIGGDLPRPSGALAGLSAGPLGVAMEASPAPGGPLRLSLPTEQFAGLETRGGYAGGDPVGSPFGTAAVLEWASESAVQAARAWIFQSIHWLNLPQTHVLTETAAAEFSQPAPVLQDTQARDEEIAALPPLEVVMPASPRRASSQPTSPGSWLALGLLAGACGMFPFTKTPERRRVSPSLPGSR